MNRIAKFFRTYNELWLGPIGFVLWVASGWLITWIDQERAAPYDMAVWQKVIFGLVVFNVCTFNALVVIRLVNPSVFRYLTRQFDSDFSNQSLTICEKLKLSLALYACYLLGLLLAMQVL